MLYPENAPGDRLGDTGSPIGGPDPRVQVFHDPARTEHAGHQKDERSLGQLFAELTKESQTLVRQEIELAKVEVTGAIGKAVPNVISIIVGGLLAYAGLIVFLIGIAYLLAEAIDLWVATVVVGVLVLAISGFLVMKGLGGLKKTNFKPERTIHTLQEDKQWLKETI